METLKVWNLVPRHRFLGGWKKESGQNRRSEPYKAWMSDAKCVLEVLYFGSNRWVEGIEV